MQKSSPKPYYSASLPVVLFVVSLVLKLTGVISWSWWWVTSPIWIVAALFVIIAIIAFIILIFQARK